MTPRPVHGRLGGVPDPAATDPATPTEPSSGSPAVAITLASGLAGLLLSLNRGAFAVALFFCAVGLAALPLALADRPGGRSLRFALLGGASALLGLALVLVPLLTGQAQRDARTTDPLRVDDRPAVPAPARATPTPPAG